MGAGDRAGSRYYSAIGGGGWSGRLFGVGFRDNVTAFMINPFVKLGGLELFGTLEWIEGSGAREPTDRSVNQHAAEAIYRFLENERVFLGTRYNTVDGEILTAGSDISVNHWQISGGWFVTQNVLAKVGYMSQSYNDDPTDNLFHGGEISGLMIEGVIISSVPVETLQVPQGKSSTEMTCPVHYRSTALLSPLLISMLPPRW